METFQMGVLTYHDSVVATLRGGLSFDGVAAVGTAPWPWPAELRRGAPRLVDVRPVRSVLVAAPVRSERLPFKEVMGWTKAGENGRVFGSPFARSLVREALVLLVSFGACQEGELRLELIEGLDQQVPGRARTTALRMTQWLAGVVVMGLVPNAPTVGDPLPLEGN
jgi:hypothetical protein